MRRVDHLLALIGLQHIQKPTSNANFAALANASYDDFVLDFQHLDELKKARKLRRSQARVIANIRAAESA